MISIVWINIEMEVRMIKEPNTDFSQQYFISPNKIHTNSSMDFLFISLTEVYISRCSYPQISN